MRDSPEHAHESVQIFMDSISHQIHRGHETVVQIKDVCGVAPTYVIELINENNQLTLLDDGASLTIKGGERFVSHVRGGGSS